MLCIQTGKSIQETNRMKFEGTQFYVKSGEEMMRMFKDAPQVLARTLDIAERCNFRLEKNPGPFPHFDVPEGFTLDSISSTSRGKDSRGAWRTYDRRPQAATQTFSCRLRAATNARARHHPADEVLGLFPDCLGLHPLRPRTRHSCGAGARIGGGRGGRVFAGDYRIDPLQHELLFERFLNPERISMPDIDIDFC